MNRHILGMIIGCGVPLLLLFVAPSIGMSSNVTLFLFIVAMFACHLFMIRHHRKGPGDTGHHH